MGSTESNDANIEILPATEDDFVTLASIESIANDMMTKTQPTGNISKIMFGPPSEGNWEHRAKGLVEKMQKDPNAKIYKAVIKQSDGQSKTIAWSNWYFNTEGSKIDDWKDIEWPPSTNAVAANEIIGSLTRLRQKYMSEKKHAFLEVLATLPGYRGLGAGSALLQRGIEDAKKEGLDDFYLSASRDGHNLYEKFGFRDLEPLGISLEKFGGIGDAPVIAMRKSSRIE